MQAQTVTIENNMLKYVHSLEIAQQEEIIAKLRKMYETARYCKIDRYYTTDGSANDRLNYPKHWEFMQQGKTYKMRAFIAPNRAGKSVAGGCEFQYHATGNYPEGWDGHVIHHAPVLWCVSTNPDTLRQGIQKLLLGGSEESQIGTGLIPKHLIHGDVIWKTGVKGLVQTVYVKHSSGEIATIHFKTCEQKRTAFEAAEIDGAWCDEEIDDDKFSEIVVRTVTLKGIVILTFTPLNGLTNTVMKFIPGGKFPNTPSKCGPGGDPKLNAWITYVDQEDVPHMTQEDWDLIWAATPPHLREARTRGIPSVGAGRIYPIEDDKIVVDGIRIQPHWPRCYAIDPGWNATAVLWAAYNEDTDTIYIYDEYQAGKEKPAIHAAVIRSKGSWIPGLIDPAGARATGVEGEKYKEIYESHGLILEKAKNDDVYGREVVWERFYTGRLKILSSCTMLMDVIRVFRFDKHGKVAPNQNDHLADVLKYIALSGPDIWVTQMQVEEDQEREREENSAMGGSTRNSVTGY